jgi:hypothetical protein
VSFSVSDSSTQPVGFRTDIIELDEKNEEEKKRRRRTLKDTSLQTVVPNTQIHTDIKIFTIIDIFLFNF